MALDLQVVTPERELVHQEVDEVQIPGKDGYLGVLPGHAPLLGELGIGELSYSAGGRNRYLAIHGGFLEILEDHVRVLANVSEKAEEIDLERARRALERAQQQVSSPPLDVDPATALAAVLRAQTRVSVFDRRQA
ncbi:MAG: F0F1 ATP synthase subunit epsilon [Acidobacteriia bacterium]|nr:F0F1 ATP synthase subunit epsilon [Terriglobia bacterium]